MEVHRGMHQSQGLSINTRTVCSVEGLLRAGCPLRGQCDGVCVQDAPCVDSVTACVCRTPPAWTV